MIHVVQPIALQKIEGQTFVGAQVQIDSGWAYIKCKFVNCTMVFSGAGSWEMQSNTMESCQFSFVGAAGNTLNFLKSLYANGAKGMVEQIVQSLRSSGESKAATPQGEPVTLQ